MANSRSKRTNKDQMEMIINFLGENRVLVTQKMHPLNTGDCEPLWDELTEKLNSVENGARKDKKQWKTFLYEWKSKTKKKARIHKASIMKTGGGGYTCKDLTDLENRLLNVLGGWIHVLGCPSLTNIEPGLPAGLELMDQDVTEIQEGAIEQHEAEREEENTDEISTPIPSQTPRRGTAPRKKQKRPHVQSTQLHEAAELYAQSTSEMAEAVKVMAGAISQLAQGLSDIAIALSNTSKT
ncbi:unnamed protein product [Acanthoscelides obtectus]|uniref:Regulatory protein zeste n=2 Tax=Acanthoscelides obtectus TaxID=200917 RepID=A0A9P0KLU7_ACAOB|nr:unnamed protein product [Acanthoscelides obtectus]CAH1977607.1 unnamed protein product [Acanthoscelides obtectus]CAH1997552.1 unnamed protein product [Acanthoscelides obtectus]CAK1634092.1 hypothetical protein AOBTE_LOCUS8600 [Acanthoscelides obtectus]CAK1657217.1 hypothetical protein AOBTE_LOCUS20215 [Acanthoscelides obtectus]